MRNFATITIPRGVVLFVALTLSWCVEAQTITSFERVRSMFSKRESVDQDLYIEGYVISDYTTKNQELNTQRYVNSVNKMSDMTAYFESLDGKYGFCLYFTNAKGAEVMPRYARAVLSLRGTTIQRQSGPVRYTIQKLTPQNIVRFERCDASVLPRKERTIKELKSEDIYTYVTLKDCEIVFKDGAFSNVYEGYAQRTELNKVAKPNGSQDCWPILLCDGCGSTMYAFVNTKCEWRRDGMGVPQGSGDMNGIVVYTHLPRYGGDVFGGMVLRPVDKNDFAMDWSAASSKYKSIAEWNWNDNGENFNTENGARKSVVGERILADVGNGAVRSEVGGTVYRGVDMNNVAIQNGKEFNLKGTKGRVNHGSMTICTEAHNWWDWERHRGKGIELEFSTEGIEGENLVVAFSFAAGEITPISSYGHPFYWGVEYTLDGVNFYRVSSRNIQLRTLPWWYGHNSMVHGTQYLSIEAGMGFTEHLVHLPKSLFGQKSVRVRIVPVAKNAATLSYEKSDMGALRPNSTTKTYVNFGSIVVRYN